MRTQSWREPILLTLLSRIVIFAFANQNRLVRSPRPCLEPPPWSSWPPQPAPPRRPETDKPAVLETGDSDAPTDPTPSHRADGGGRADDRRARRRSGGGEHPADLDAAADAPFGRTAIGLHDTRRRHRHAHDHGAADVERQLEHHLPGRQRRAPAVTGSRAVRIRLREQLRHARRGDPDPAAHRPPGRDRCRGFHQRLRFDHRRAVRTRHADRAGAGSGPGVAAPARARSNSSSPIRPTSR